MTARTQSGSKVITPGGAPMIETRWIDIVREYLHQSKQPKPIQATAAAAFAMSETAFKNRLREYGTSWQTECAAEQKRRFEVATSMGQIQSGGHYTELCGFNETISFYRAFKRWYGMNFRDWRALQDCWPADGGQSVAK